MKNNSQQLKETPIPDRGLLKGLKSLADFLGCSVSTAQKIKNSGRITYIKIGGKFYFDPQKVLQGVTEGAEDCS